MKKTYSAVTLRYVHDVVTGEFVNVGVVLYAPEQRLLKGRFTGSYERLDAMFPSIDHQHISAMMCCIANGIEDMSSQMRSSANLPSLNSLAEMVKRILPSDDSSLQWSEQGGGFTDDPEKTLKQSFNRFVERYQSALNVKLHYQF